tara:strand:- start:734 stop:1588 length:855 start_codon:yes stop_codon:yes gene_type:complete
MTIIVIGKSGQLAQELATLDERVICLSRTDIDITDSDSVALTLSKYDVTGVINASAYTAVDKAESEQSQAYAINTVGVGNLAKYTNKENLSFVHVSTDYVFSGDKGSPYLVNDPHAPIGVYGRSKAEGEMAIEQYAANVGCIIRTSWVYSRFGNNFVKTMLRLMAEKTDLSIIDDQIGSPTSAKALANACLYAVNNNVTGTHHYTDSGVCSWYDFAVAIQSLALEKGLLTHAIPIKPISSLAYPTPAKRPHYSVLDKSTLAFEFSGLIPQYWRKALSDMLDELT